MTTEKEAVDALIKMMNSSAGPSLRVAAVEGLGYAVGPDARAALVKVMNGSAGPEIRQAAAWALGYAAQR